MEKHSPHSNSLTGTNTPDDNFERNQSPSSDNRPMLGRLHAFRSLIIDSEWLQAMHLCRGKRIALAFWVCHPILQREKLNESSSGLCAPRNFTNPAANYAINHIYTEPKVKKNGTNFSVAACVRIWCDTSGA